jgi:hypothetical protein
MTSPRSLFDSGPFGFVRSLLRFAMISILATFLLVPAVLVGLTSSPLIGAGGVLAFLMLTQLVGIWLPGPSLLALIASAVLYVIREFLHVIWVGATAFLRRVLELERQEASLRRRRHLSLVYSS